jgi:hypothetical protein
MQPMSEGVKLEMDLWAEWPSGTQRRIMSAALESFAESGFHGTSAEHAAEVAALRRETEQVVRALIEGGIRTSAFSVPDAAAAAAAVLSLGIDVARWYRRGGRWTPEQLGELYAELAACMVGASVASAD